MGTTDSKAMLAVDLQRMKSQSLPDDDNAGFDHLFELPTSAMVRVLAAIYEQFGYGKAFRGADVHEPDFLAA